MKLVVFSHKPCWPSASSPTGYATDGGFPYQMRAISELFDRTTLVVPCSPAASGALAPRDGEIPLHGRAMRVMPATRSIGSGLRRKLTFPFWAMRNVVTIARAILDADAVHTPIPGDVGTIGMVLAVALRKPLFVRHCGNWLAPRTRAEHFWRWFVERYAGGRNVMLATGGTEHAPSMINPNVRWIFSTSMTEAELRAGRARSAVGRDRTPRLIIVCRQERAKGTDTAIAALPAIARAFPGVTLDVVGDGGYVGALREAAERLGVGEQVVFHGKKDHDEVIGLLDQADLFVYPTRASEGFPKVVLEALATGLPVVTTRVSVLPALIGAGGGALLDAATPDEVASTVVEILTDGRRYETLSRCAIDTAAQYSLERWRDTIGAALAAAWRQPLAKESKRARAGDEVVES